MDTKKDTARPTASLIVQNGVVINVFTRELLENHSVAIAGDTILYVGPEPGPYTTGRTEILDAAGALIIPGFIDSHNHLDSLLRNEEWARRILPTGCTTVVTEMAMVAGAGGPAMVEWFMKSGRGLPMRMFFLAPPSIPPFPEFETAHDFPEQAYDDFLVQKDVLGVGEAYWPMILKPNKRVLDFWKRSRNLGKTCEGHSAGARGDKLVHYVYSGATSCHESISWEEALEKARLGMAVMIREGFVRHDLEAVSPVFAKARDLRNFILVSDGFAPEDLVEGEGLNALVRKAIKLGADPVSAVQMASLNPAQYYNLRDLGGLAPGRKADLFLADGFETMKAGVVIADGKVVAENGKMKVDIPQIEFPAEVYQTIATSPMSPSFFAIPADPSRKKARVVSILNETVTKELVVDYPQNNGMVTQDTERDIVKLAMINRQRREPTGSVALLHGTGLKSGAIATNVIWDTTNMLVIGADDEAMADAVNRLIHIGGGWVAWDNGGVIAEVPLPAFGLMTEVTLPEFNEATKRLLQGLQRLGLRMSRPFLSVQTLAFTGLPFLRLTDKGIVDVRQGRFVPLFCE